MRKKSSPESRTVAEAAEKYLIRAGGEAVSAEIKRDVAAEMGTTEATVAQALSALKKEGRADSPRKGLWTVVKSHESQAARKQKVSAQPELPDDVVLVVRYPDTGKVWWSAKLSFQVQVHERLEFVGGKDSNKVAVHVQGSREGAE
jgi:hypothetical protein